MGHDRVFDSRQRAGPLEWRMRLEKGFILQLEHRQINAWGDRLNGGGDLVTRLVGLHLHLAGVEHHVSVREDAFAFDNHPAAGGLACRQLRPRLPHVRITHRGENLYHRVFDHPRLWFGGQTRASRVRGLGGSRFLSQARDALVSDGKADAQQQTSEPAAPK